MRTYASLPDIPSAGLHELYRNTLGVIVPVARTNLVLNPSVETNTTGYTAVGGSIARSTAQQAHGAYSLAITPTAGTTDGAYYGTVGLTSGVTYAVSCKVLGAAGVPYALSLATTGGADLARRTFVGSGRWQWVWLFYTETSTTTRRVYLRKDTSTSTAVFYVDGLQVEACGSEGVFVTTYIDGDQRGLIANQQPPAYQWAGTPHASISLRSGQTRAGGRVMRFKDFGFLLSVIIGLGLAPPQVEALSFAQLDGAQYQRTRKAERTISLVGRWADTTPRGMSVARGQLSRLLDRDAVAAQQPLVLTMQAEESGVPVGAPIAVAASYVGGLEGENVNLPTGAARMDFTQFLPVILGGSEGATLTAQQSVSNANAIIRRRANGTYQSLSTGLSGGTTSAFALFRSQSGLIYVGGDFTDAGGSGADYLAAYNPLTDTFSVVGSATAINATVDDITEDPAGQIYIVGNFTNAGGNPDADRIAVWDGVSWIALGVAGPNARVLSIARASDGTIYIGGQFTDVGGSGADYIARYSGGTWSVLGSATALNAQVSKLLIGPDGRTLYVAGAFTNAGGVGNADYIAVWNPVTSSWGALGTGMDNPVNTLAFDAAGILYAGGTFTTAGGVPAAFVAQWNGTQWEPLGSGLTGGVGANVSALTVLGDETLLAGGFFDTAGGVAVPDSGARWNGSAWLPLDVDLPAAAAVREFLGTPGGEVYVGYAQSGTATTGAITTVVNDGTAAAYPRLTIRGPSSGTSRIYQLVNTTTGQAIYFNLALSAGETAVLTLDPQNITFVSSFQGNILRTILPGSQTSGWGLQPGANDISFFAASSSVTAVLDWETAYASLDDALYQATP